MPDKNTSSNRLVKIFAGVAIFFLAGVLVLTLGRVLNLESVLQLPRADDGSNLPRSTTRGGSNYCGVAADQISCVNNCFTNIKSGNCSYCRNFCANGGKVSRTPTPAPTGSQSPTPTPTGTVAPEVVCQGNVNAPAKCFSCLKDVGGDQVNILDFACFAKWFGQNVGKT